MKDTAKWLTEYQHRLDGLSDKVFVNQYEAFVSWLAALDENEGKFFSDDNGFSFHRIFTNYQRRYLSIQERVLVSVLLGSDRSPEASIGARLKSGFGKNSYDRVQDMARIVDFSKCRRVMMVGCGAFPATLFWLYDHFPGKEYVGLDIDADSMALAEKLTGFWGISDIRFTLCNGSKQDYSGVDFVYVANQVVPKRDTLLRIRETSDRAIQVVVREPTPRGCLLAESIRGNIPEGYIVLSEGLESRAFLSMDLFLQLNNTEK